MNFQKVMDYIISNNIDQEAMYELVEEASKLDLKDEDNLRSIIQKGAKLTNRDIPKDKEDGIVTTILNEGISPKLFDYLISK